MYKNNFIAAIKVNDVFLKEDSNNVITLPFNSEYSLYLKNNDSRNVKVNISIDGKDVLDNSSLIINGNSFAELKGFLKNDTVKRKFKFIRKPKDSNTSDNTLDEGSIRIEFTYTKKPSYTFSNIKYAVYYPLIQWTNNRNYSSEHVYYENINGVESYNVQCSNSNGENFSIKSDNIPSIYSTQETLEKLAAPKTDEGITVKGSEVNEKLVSAWIGELESESDVITITLKGIETLDNKSTVSLNNDIYCTYCGFKVKSKDNFCKNCGNKIK